MHTLPLSEPVAPHALMAPARRVMSHEYGSTQFDIKVQMSWFLPGSTSSSRNPILASKFHRHHLNLVLTSNTAKYFVLVMGLARLQVRLDRLTRGEPNDGVLGQES